MIESLVAYVFTLHLKARDHTKFNLNFPWYSLRMSVKGPHRFWSRPLAIVQSAQNLSVGGMLYVYFLVI